jgi:hypothetical protein
VVREPLCGVLAPCLDHHPQQRLGTRRPDQDATVAAQLGLDVGAGLAEALVDTLFGNTEKGLYMTGSAIGRINDIVPAEEFLEPLKKLCVDRVGSAGAADGAADVGDTWPAIGGLALRPGPIDPAPPRRLGG